MTRETSVLTVEGLETSYGQSQVLFGVDLEVRRGEVVTLLGRNGMGKTTTIRSIMGMTAPHGGSVRFEGRQLRGLTSFRIAKLGLASTARIIHGDLMLQDYSDADLLTVYLLPVSNDKVTPMLEKQLKKGTRIVAHDFEFSAWKPDKIQDIDDDGEGRSHRLYLYRR